MTVEWVPEFEGQRPPFAPGNQLSRRHGAWSVVAQDDAQAAVLEEANRLNPGWVQLVDVFEAEAWAYAEGRCRLYRKALGEMGSLMRPDGKPWQAELELRAWTKVAAQHRQALGFNPLARGRLGADTAMAQASLARLGESGRALVEKHAPRGEDAS